MDEEKEKEGEGDEGYAVATLDRRLLNHISIPSEVEHWYPVEGETERPSDCWSE